MSNYFITLEQPPYLFNYFLAKVLPGGIKLIWYNKPVCRTKGSSRTFGDVVLLFFQDGGKIQTMMVFGKPLRACEILRIWSQHHGIEQFWAEYACGILHDLKTDLKLSSMSLEGRHGAYANLGVKVMSYLLIQQVKQV